MKIVIWFYWLPKIKIAGLPYYHRQPGYLKRPVAFRPCFATGLALALILKYYFYNKFS